MVFENIDSLLLAQGLHIARIHLAIAGQIKPEPAHGVNAHPVFGSPARVIRVIHIAAFAAHNISGYLVY
jgi:hypothetical protein